MPAADRGIDNEWLAERGIGVEVVDGRVYYTGWQRPTLAEVVRGTEGCGSGMQRYRQLMRYFGLCWFNVPPGDRFGLVADEPESLGERWDAFAAGYAEELCQRDGVDVPAWAHRPERYLDYLWFPAAPTEFFRLMAMTAPAPWFAEHGVLVEDRELIAARDLIEGKGAAIWNR